METWHIPVKILTGEDYTKLTIDTAEVIGNHTDYVLLWLGGLTTFYPERSDSTSINLSEEDEDEIITNGHIAES